MAPSRLSPDDKRAALERTGARAGVWVLDVATGIPTRLTFGPESDPVWSPDGGELVFSDTSGSLTYKGDRKECGRGPRGQRG